MALILIAELNMQSTKANAELNGKLSARHVCLEMFAVLESHMATAHAYHLHDENVACDGLHVSRGHQPLHTQMHLHHYAQIVT